jgi:hypothetical protein
VPSIIELHRELQRARANPVLFPKVGHRWGAPSLAKRTVRSCAHATETRRWSLHWQTAKNERARRDAEVLCVILPLRSNLANGLCLTDLSLRDHQFRSQRPQNASGPAERSSGRTVTIDWGKLLWSSWMCKTPNLRHEKTVTGACNPFVLRLSFVSKNVQEMDPSAICYERKKMP